MYFDPLPCFFIDAQFEICLIKEASSRWFLNPFDMKRVVFLNILGFSMSRYVVYFILYPSSLDMQSTISLKGFGPF